MWPWSQRQGRTCLKPIYRIYCELLCHFLSENVHIWQNDYLWCVVCLIWSLLSQSIFFSVKSCQNGSYWVELSLSRLLYVLPVMSVSCDLVGKGWPLGSLVCDVFLCFVTFPYRVLGHVWYLIVSPSDFCFLLYFAQWQYEGSTYETQTSNLSISTQTLYHWVLHFHYCVWWLQWKFQITAMIWSLTSRTNISCTFWREFLFHFC